MKLTIIRLQYLSKQERIDLQKVWPQTDIPLLEQQLSAEQQLYAARFNDRLLAAVRVTLEGQQGRLNQLEVREVTRRRGVGLYLLQEVMAQNPAVSIWSAQHDGAPDPAVSGAFMQAAGFSLQGGEWRYSSQQKA